MLSNDTGKLYRVVRHISYWPQYAHRDLKEHLITSSGMAIPDGDYFYNDKTLCGLIIKYREWEVVIGANEEIDLLNKCKKCLKIKEKYNAEIY